MKKIVIAAAVVALVVSASGCVNQRDHEALVARTAQMEKDVAQSHADVVALHADLEATRQRLDNALRANADSSGDYLASKQRLNELAGRVDEINHGIDDLKRDVGASRTELYARIDELKRSQQPPPPPPAPIAVPADKDAHYKQLDAAFAKHDFATVRALGPEYVNRYPSDDKADEALFFLGSADLQDGRPSSALGPVQPPAEAVPALQRARSHALRDRRRVPPHARLRERQGRLRRMREALREGQDRRRREGEGRPDRQEPARDVRAALSGAERV